MLKEEIRRQERNETRAEASSNLEYLKNVLIKFFEFGDEQDDLIPVMGKLLHFSPDEVKRIKRARVAKAQHSGAPSALDSLSSYLPKWT